MWEKVKLGHLCKIRTGKLDVNAENLTGIYPFFTCSKNHTYIDHYAFDEEAIIVAGNGDLNVKYYKGKFNAYQRTYIINPSNKINGKFLFYFLDQYVSVLRNESIGGVIKYIKLGNLTEAVIPLPPLPIQEKIAKILDKADELRRKDKELQAKYDELAQAIFIDMFGDPVKNEKGFKLGTIRELVREVKYGTSSPAQENGEYPYLRMNNITYGGDWDFSSIKYINASDSDYLKYGLEYGDLIFNRTNSKELVGKTAVFRDHDRVIIAGYLIRVRVNNVAHPDYISGYLNSKHGKLTLQNICKNIVGQANINAQELQDIKILIPPLHLQEAFAKKIELINQLKAQTNTAKSEELFQSLLQQAFRGELVTK